MRIIAAINTGLDADLSVHALFDAPTVAQLAAHIGADEGRLKPLVAVERPAVIPLSFAQNRLWFLDQLQGPSPVYNMAVALQLRGKLDVDALRAAFDDVIGRHEIAAYHIPRHRRRAVPAGVAAPVGRGCRGCHRCRRMATSPAA